MGWSVGCILGELIGGRPLFPGTSTMNQLERVVEVTGKPSEEDIASIKSGFASAMLQVLPPNIKKKSLREILPRASEEALDLMAKLMTFNPNHRLSADEALKHPYVIQFSSPEEEVEVGRVIEIPIDDNTKFSVDNYRDRLYEEVLRRRKEARRKQRAMQATMDANAPRTEADVPEYPAP
eukprot:GDKK01028445.1.p1 GENE.GDKK01028445.1~~GDKK01028445.1.p1  ORF type:complete len:180 (+),score=57.08 GDKK01028445.1:1-540(+)